MAYKQISGFKKLKKVSPSIEHGNFLILGEKQENKRSGINGVSAKKIKRNLVSYVDFLFDDAMKFNYPLEKMDEGFHEIVDLIQSQRSGQIPRHILTYVEGYFFARRNEVQRSRETKNAKS